MNASAPARVVFFGTPEVALPTLQALCEVPWAEVIAVVTQPDRPAGRNRALHQSAVKVEAARRGIPVLQPASVKKSQQEFLAQLAAFGSCDLGVVIAFGQILPPAVLARPRLGCVNLHASLLPRWRGAAPMQRALMHGDTETGVCLMQMEEGLDSGPVFASLRLGISPGENFGSLHDRIAQAAAELSVREIPGLLGGELHAVPQPAHGVSLAPKVSNEEAQIDWSRTSKDVANLVRALSPLPGAYTLFDGKRLKIFAARAAAGEDGGVPGTLLGVSSEVLRVACGAGALEVTELQLEGRKRLPAAEFMKGCDLRAGARLGK